MTLKTAAILPLGLGVTLALGAWVAGQEPKKDAPANPPAQAPKSTGEAVSKTVDDVVQRIERGAKATSVSVQAQYQRLRASVHDMGVQARVYSRLHWDKDLNGAKLEVEVKEGTAILRGAFRTARAKAKAVQLASDTVGVDRVEDQTTLDQPAPAGKTKP